VKNKIARFVCQKKPKDGTHWSTRGISAQFGISHTAVNTILNQYGIKPHLVKKFKFSSLNKGIRFSCLGTITGSSKVPFRSLGTSIVVLWFSSSTVFSVCPFRLFPLLSPSLEFFSYPKCSVISALRARCSIFPVSCLIKPSCPTTSS
jgi:hypothetical protein